MQNLILVFAAFCLAERGIYSQKPYNHDPGEVGGANAPPNSPRLPQKRGFCRIFAALVWPGGHTKRGVAPGLKWGSYLMLVFLLLLQPLTESAFDFLASIPRFKESFSQPRDMPR